MLGVAAILVPVEFGRTRPPIPSPVNVLIAVVLLAPVSRWSADAAKALLLLVGFVSLAWVLKRFRDGGPVLDCNGTLPVM